MEDRELARLLVTGKAGTPADGVSALSYAVIGCAFRVHNELGPGFLESVYEAALAIELADAGIHAARHVPMAVHYKGRTVGEYVADMVVERRLIVEIKAVRALAPEHEVQLVHYLTATGLNDGLLINFGPSVQVKHKFHGPREERPVANPNSQPQQDEPAAE